MKSPIVLSDENTWPRQVVAALAEHRDVLLGWEQRRAGKMPSHSAHAHAFDAAIYAIRDALSGHCIHGYHCTRLTEAEINQITAQGMSLQNGATLARRIDVLQEAGVVTAIIANRLKSNNQGDEINRAGMLWFCFYPPYRARQDGIERFFRSWGGEALYNSHEGDAETGPVLREIGIPCLIEADVALSESENESLAFTLARIFLIKGGHQTSECVDHEGYAMSSIPQQNVRRIIRFPSEDFMRLTHAQNWNPPLLCSISALVAASRRSS